MNRTDGTTDEATDGMTVLHVADPEPAPAPGETLFRVHAAPLSEVIDLYIYAPDLDEALRRAEPEVQHRFGWSPERTFIVADTPDPA